jgi:hypothetical protein
MIFTPKIIVREHHDGGLRQARAEDLLTARIKGVVIDQGEDWIRLSESHHTPDDQFITFEDVSRRVSTTSQANMPIDQSEAIKARSINQDQNLCAPLDNRADLKPRGIHI